MLTDIRLQNFRSYKDNAFEFDTGVNIIVGPNASGKTNLLEAVLMICHGKSYRAQAAEQVYFGKSWARLDAHSLNEGVRTVKLQSNAERFVKSFEIDKKPYARLPLGQTLPLVLFEPQHLLLLTGQPELRRDFLDELLEQTEVGFGSLRRAYKRALAQRNRLLKTDISKGVTQHLFAWNVRLSELGAQLAEQRMRLIALFNKQITDLYRQLSHSQSTIGLRYDTAQTIQNYGSSLLKKLEVSQELDLLRGYTGYGPHRDDLEVKLNGYNVQDTASRGEIRTILLAFKVLELQLLEELRGVKPLLLLDDVFSELDGARRRALTGYLKNYQSFITTTDADVVVHNFAQKCNVITMQ